MNGSLYITSKNPTFHRLIFHWQALKSRIIKKWARPCVYIHTYIVIEKTEGGKLEDQKKRRLWKMQWGIRTSETRERNSKRKKRADDKLPLWHQVIRTLCRLKCFMQDEISIKWCSNFLFKLLSCPAVKLHIDCSYRVIWMKTRFLILNYAEHLKAQYNCAEV